jgi:hypothetical protein
MLINKENASLKHHLRVYGGRKLQPREFPGCGKAVCTAVLLKVQVRVYEKAEMCRV